MAENVRRGLTGDAGALGHTADNPVERAWCLPERLVEGEMARRGYCEGVSFGICPCTDLVLPLWYGEISD